MKLFLRTILLMSALCLLVPRVANALILEDFEQGNLALFTFTPTPNGGDQNNMTLVASAAHDGAFGAHFIKNFSGWFWRNDYTPQTQPGYRIYTYVRFSTVSGKAAHGSAYFGVGATAAGTISASISNTGTARTLSLLLNSNYGFTTLASAPVSTLSPNTWYRLEVDYGLGLATANFYDETGTTLLATTRSIRISFIDKGGLAFRAFLTDDGFIDMDTVTIANDLPAVTGNITLEECFVQSQNLTFEFRPTNGLPAFTRIVHTDSNGHYRTPNVPASTYNVAVKGSKWLQKVIPLTVEDNREALLDVTLLTGDIVENNAVDLDDLGALSLAFDTQEGDASYDPQADLNCDGLVNLDDLGLLSLHFDEVGDP